MSAGVTLQEFHIRYWFLWDSPPPLLHICGPVVNAVVCNRRCPSSIPGEVRINPSLSNFCYRPVMGERSSNFAIFVVWSSSYVSAESLEPEGSISSCRFYGQLAGYYSLVFSLTQLMNSPSGKWGRGFNPRFHLVVFVFGVSQDKWGRKGRQGESKIHQWWRASLQIFQL